ncbi:MAG TPA: hypothetical protein VFE97_22465, partial [Methylomirabilota bacterium]|nr:hypothetical protein [Methylomirabilota bacterium]
ARRILREDHRRDGQRCDRNRYDSRPPHVALSVIVEIHCTNYTASTLSLAMDLGSNGGAKRERAIQARCGLDLGVGDGRAGRAPGFLAAGNCSLSVPG